MTVVKKINTNKLSFTDKNKTETKQNESVKSTLVLSSTLRNNPEVSAWRMAVRSAENPLNPNRTRLYDIYEEALLDGMLTSVTERLKLKCTNSKIIFKKNGQMDGLDPVSQMIQTPEFLDLIRYIVESKWFGHSLVEILFKEQNIDSIYLVPRKHVKPESQMVTYQVNGTQGFNYKQLPYVNYLLDIGHQYDLGLLNKATPYTIYKKLGLANWGEFIEIFGVPIRKFFYDSTNPNSRNEVETQAKKTGASATVVMPKGTDFDVIKGADGNGSTVFSDYKKANDEEILLIFLLQTMTTLDGSSRSQAEVHERGEDDLIRGYKLFVELTLNYKFLPMLRLHGFDVEGGRFQYDDSKPMTKAELLEMLQGLSQFGDIPLDFIEKNFGIKLSPKEKQAIQNSLQKHKHKHQHLRYGDVCCNDFNTPINDLVKLTLSDTELQMLKAIYDKGGNYDFDPQYFEAISEYLLSGLDSELDNVKIDYDSPDNTMRTMLELNTFQFSATKDIALLEELNALLPDSQTFADFKEQAASIVTDYNENWLKAEYDLAKSTAMGAANYIRNMEVADSFPYWEYKTAGDERVRSEHQPLDGLLFKAGEMGSLYPPNGWGCRCEIIPRQASYAEGKEIYNEEGAINEIGSENYSKMRKEGFAVDRIQTAEVFTQKQLYTPIDDSSFGFEEFGLKPYKELQNNAPSANLVERTEAEAQTWFDARTGQYEANDKTVRLLDSNKRPIDLDFNTLKDNDLSVLNVIEDAIAKPDEVYFVKEDAKTYTLAIVKYYNPSPLVVQVNVKRGKIPTVLGWELSKKPDSSRKGLLYKRPKTKK